MKELKFNLRTLLQRREFHFSLFVIFFVSIIHVIMTIQYVSVINYTLENTFSAGYQFILYNELVSFDSIIIVVFPIAATMLFSDISIEEKQKGITNVLFTRINKRKNICIRFILSFIIPFLVCFFAFYLNYFLMKQLFLDGMTISNFQSVAFYNKIYPEYFLDTLRYNNLELYILALTTTTSIVIASLSTLAYALSFYLKKKIYLYIMPLVVIVGEMIIFQYIHLEHLSIIQFLQAVMKYSIWDVFFSTGLLLLISICLIIPHFRKEEMLS